ncbi:hypothetical protein HPB48_019094 [Haemaphysalis longicornis]|uniref:Transmembrane protein 177 n=1 Tax=Haemaphysalis longicornis TaxID=44386 RepID=A0A9J6G752_HAELO|nr:hypothetical protein HPB48_019094 [Haemaphysalis longicornis]
MTFDSTLCLKHCAPGWSSCASGGERWPGVYDIYLCMPRASLDLNVLVLFFGGECVEKNQVSALSPGAVCKQWSFLLLLVDAFFVARGHTTDKNSFFFLNRDGEPMELDPLVQKRAYEVLQTVDLPQRKKDMVHFFPVPLLDPFFAGSTEASHGAILGLPVTFSYARKEDVQTRSLLLRGTREPAWETREGEALKKALVLSDRAQRFAIARDLYWASTYYVQIQTAALSFAVVNCYFMGRLINDRFRLLGRVPRSLRVGLYGVIVAINATVYLCFKDATSQFWDRKADEKAAALGRDYVEGGIEFYEKALQRNRALRELLGDEGRKYYTSKGNLNELIRSTHVPLTHRLDTVRRFASDYSGGGGLSA